MFFSILCLFLSHNAHAVPLHINQQGRLLDNNGEGLSGSNQMIFKIYDSEIGGDIYWSDTLTAEFRNGYYSVLLGTDEESNPLDHSVLELYPLFLELTVNGETLEPRHALTSVPYAQIAGVAESVNGGPVYASEISVGGQPVIDSEGNWVGNGQSVDFMDLSGRPQGLDDGDDDTQLLQTEVIDYVNGAQVNLGSASQVDGSDIVTADSFYGYLPSDLVDGDADTLASISCAQGEILAWDGSTSWICVSDNTLDEGTVETYITNGIINLFTGSQVDGYSILTENSQLDWNKLYNVPSSGSTSLSTTQVTLSQNQEHTITPTSSDFLAHVEYLDPIENIWLPIPKNSSSGACDICGTSADGDYLAYPIDSPTPVHVTLQSGTYNYASFTIPTNVIVDVIGTDPLYIHVTGKAEIRGQLQLAGADAQCTYLGPCPGGEAGAGGSDGGQGGNGSQVPKESGTEMDWDRTDLYFGSDFQGGTGGTGHDGRYQSNWYPQCNHYGAAGGGGGGAVKLVAQSIEIQITDGIDVSGGSSIRDTTNWDSACGSQSSGTDGNGGSIWLIGGKIDLASDALNTSGQTAGHVRIDSSNRISYSGEFYKVNDANKIADFEYYTTVGGDIIIKNNVFDTVEVRARIIQN